MLISWWSWKLHNFLGLSFFSPEHCNVCYKNHNIFPEFGSMKRIISFKVRGLFATEINIDFTYHIQGIAFNLASGWSARMCKLKKFICEHYLKSAQFSMLSQHWLTNLIKARVTPYDMKIFQQLHYVAGKLRIYMFARVTNDLSFSL